jgi:hypothetical protein
VSAVLAAPAVPCGLDRALFAVCLLLLAAAVLADRAGDPDAVGPKYEDVYREEIFDSAGDWRKAPETDDRWRAPLPEPTLVDQGRIQFGRESVYEDFRQRPEEEFSSRTFDDRNSNTQPSTLFRFRF